MKDDDDVLESADQEHERLLLWHGLHFSLGKVEEENGNQRFCSRIPLKKKGTFFFEFSFDFLPLVREARYRFESVRMRFVNVNILKIKKGSVRRRTYKGSLDNLLFS